MYHMSRLINLVLFQSFFHGLLYGLSGGVSEFLHFGGCNRGANLTNENN